MGADTGALAEYASTLENSGIQRNEVELKIGSGATQQSYKTEGPLSRARVILLSDAKNFDKFCGRGRPPKNALWSRDPWGRQNLSFRPGLPVAMQSVETQPWTLCIPSGRRASGSAFHAERGTSNPHLTAFARPRIYQAARRFAHIPKRPTKINAVSVERETVYNLSNSTIHNLSSSH